MPIPVLHVVTARFNPLRYESPHRNYLAFVDAMSVAPNVSLTVIEAQEGERPFNSQATGVNHIGVRTRSRLWAKESLLMAAIRQLPADAEYIAWVDADVIFRRKDWAEETVHHLQYYSVVQPWSDCYDLGPAGEHIQHFRSFARQYARGETLSPYPQAAYAFPHPGYAWAIRRDVLEAMGGLFELGIAGSGDHHMAYGLIGRAGETVPQGASQGYRDAVLAWQQAAVRAVNGRIGYVQGTVEHLFHGPKKHRGYMSRWSILKEHGFDPATDLTRNLSGVLEWAGNKPALERDLDRYLLSRNEDSNDWQ